MQPRLIPSAASHGSHVAYYSSSRCGWDCAVTVPSEAHTRTSWQMAQTSQRVELGDLNTACPHTLAVSGIGCAATTARPSSATCAQPLLLAQHWLYHTTRTTRTRSPPRRRHQGLPQMLRAALRVATLCPRSGKESPSHLPTSSQGGTRHAEDDADDSLLTGCTNMPNGNTQEDELDEYLTLP